MKRALPLLLVLIVLIAGFVDARGSVPLPVAFFKPASTSASSEPTLTITNGLLARWESDNITGLNEGDFVATWPDQSGSARDATQNTVTPQMRPTFRTNIFGSKPAVRFDGLNDELDFSDSPVTNFTVVVAWNLVSVGNWSFGPLRWRPGTSGGPGFSLTADNTVGTTDNPVKHLVVWTAAGTQIGNKNGPNESLNLSVGPRGKVIDTWRWDGTTATMRKNGSSQTVSAGTSTGLSIGGTDNIGFPYNYCGGDVAAILVYDTALSDPDVVTVETYLNAKYPCF